MFVSFVLEVLVMMFLKLMGSFLIVFMLYCVSRLVWSVVNVGFEVLCLLLSLWRLV